MPIFTAVNDFNRIFDEKNLFSFFAVDVIATDLRRLRFSSAGSLILFLTFAAAVVTIGGHAVGSRFR